jgi:hypothetical protein
MKQILSVPKKEFERCELEYNSKAKVRATIATDKTENGTAKKLPTELTRIRDFRANRQRPGNAGSVLI